MNEFDDIQSLQTVRQHFHEVLGTDTVRDLHRPIPWLDAMAVGASMTLFIAVFLVIGFADPSSFLLVVLALLQGWLIQTMGLIGHDLFVHREMWKGRVGTILGSLVFVPATMSGRIYRIGHLRHHAKIGTADDTEAGLVDINTIVRRFLFLTLIGFKLARAGKWDAEGVHGYKVLDGATQEDHLVIAAEKRALIGFVAIIMLLALLAPWRVVVFGYILPILIVAPFLSSIRVILEHAVVDSTNAFSLATPYRTGTICQALYFVNPGDCHLMHHVFPRVPWYHMSRLIRLGWPILEANGVTPRTSLTNLLKGWFIKNYPHRTDWPA